MHYCDETPFSQHMGVFPAVCIADFIVIYLLNCICNLIVYMWNIIDCEVLRTRMRLQRGDYLNWLLSHPHPTYFVWHMTTSWHFCHTAIPDDTTHHSGIAWPLCERGTVRGVGGDPIDADIRGRRHRSDSAPRPQLIGTDLSRPELRPAWQRSNSHRPRSRWRQT